MRKYKKKVFDKIVLYSVSFYSIIAKQYHKGEYNPAFKMIIYFLIGDIITNDKLNLGIHEFVHALTFHGEKSKDISASIFYRGYKNSENFVDKEYGLEAVKKSYYFRSYAFTNKICCCNYGAFF